MARPSRKLRWLLFLYSNGNIAGSALALLGPALLFAGLIKSGWLLITAGLYGVGWLLGRRPPELERAIADTLTVEQTLEHLDRLVAQAAPHLSEEMKRSLASIRVSVAEVLPRLLDKSAAGREDLYTVRETVLRDLPETLANYVALPPAFRANHALEDGQTARQLLAEQLGVLHAKMREVVANVAASDAQALVANGRFLEARFRQPDFLAR
jgi:hypothetical protein